MTRMQLTRTKLVAMVCLLAAVATQVQVSLAKHAHHGQHGHHSHNHGHGNGDKDGKHGKEKVDTWLDAFDEEKCGEANLRSWQREQSAFGCTQANDSYEPSKDSDAVKGFGKRANEGEFPFYVRIKAVGNGNKTEHCSGILVSKDIVITTADRCLRPESGEFKQVYLEFGAVMKDGGGAVKRDGVKWCTSANNSTFAEDLVVISLNTPVHYVPGKIGPACMRRPNEAAATHSNETTCALAASCTTSKWMENIPGWLPAPGDELRSIAVKRAAACKEGHKMLPYENCYIGKDTGKICEGDRGGPLVCYDKCSKKNKDKVQAFVVGALSQYDNHNSYSKAPSTVIDFVKSYARIMELLKAVRNNRHGVGSTDITRCYEGQYWG